MFLGTKSGMYSNRMKYIEINSIKTPLGNMAFKEEWLIIKCKLTQITTANADAFIQRKLKHIEVLLINLHIKNAYYHIELNKYILNIIKVYLRRCYYA